MNNIFFLLYNLTIIMDSYPISRKNFHITIGAFSGLAFYFAQGIFESPERCLPWFDFKSILKAFMSTNTDQVKKLIIQILTQGSTASFVFLKDNPDLLKQVEFALLALLVSTSYNFSEFQRRLDIFGNRKNKNSSKDITSHTNFIRYDQGHV